MQPGLYTASNNDATVAAHWLLDKNSKPLFKSGIIDQLLRHIDDEVTKKIQPMENTTDIQYDISFAVVVGSSIIFRFGSSHAFTNPLFEARFSQIDIDGAALVSSQSGWFVPEKEFISTDEDNNVNRHENGNHVNFRTMMSAMYLNTKHNHMECLIEPYPSFGMLTYQVLGDSRMRSNDDDDDDGMFALMTLF